MAHRTLVSMPVNEAGLGKHTCPICSGSLVRIWRRPIDRLITQFVPMHRYRCQTFSCRWEGNFRMRRDTLVARRAQSRAVETAGIDLADAARANAGPKSFIAPIALAAVVGLFAVVFATTDWSSGSELASTESDARIQLVFVPLSNLEIGVEQPHTKPLRTAGTAFK